LGIDDKDAVTDAVKAFEARWVGRLGTKNQQDLWKALDTADALENKLMKRLEQVEWEKTKPKAADIAGGKHEPVNPADYGIDKGAAAELEKKIGRRSKESRAKAVRKLDKEQDTLGWYSGEDSKQLRDTVSRVMSGDASPAEKEFISNMYANTQVTLGKEYPKLSSYNLHRGVLVSNDDPIMKALEKGNAADIGRIGHWSVDPSIATDFAIKEQSSTQRAPGTTTSVVFHKSFARGQILDCYMTGLTDYTEEREFVPMSAGSHRVARVERGKQELATGQRVDRVDVYLE
jgi:hypothetical protein